MLNETGRTRQNRMGRKEENYDSYRGGIPVLSLLRNLLFSYIMSAALLLVLAFFLYRFQLGEKPVAAAIIGIYILSTVFLGFLTGKTMENKKFLWGLFLGLLYFVVLAVISMIVKGSTQSLGNHFFSTLILCAGGGMLGGMLS